MNYQHHNLAQGRCELLLVEQMANIGSEVERTIKWKNKKNKEFANKVFDRALELFDLTITDKKNIKRLKEVLRVRELFCDFYFGDCIWQTTDSDWQKYFYQFNSIMRLEFKEFYNIKYRRL